MKNPMHACFALLLTALAPLPAHSQPLGRALYLETCSACHDPPGPDGRGISVVGRSLQELIAAQMDIEEMRGLNTPYTTLQEIARYLATLPAP